MSRHATRASFAAALAAALLALSCSSSPGDAGGPAEQGGAAGAGGGIAGDAAADAADAAPEAGDDGAADAASDTGADAGSDASGGDGGCVDACNGGAKQCSGAQVETCTLQASGCYAWGAAEDCGANLTCSGGHCVLACSDQCSAGQKQCVGGKPETCDPQASGCYGWSAPGTCPSGTTCSGGSCASSCNDQCAGGQKRCSGANVQSCDLQSNGCYDWSATASCQTNYTCTGFGQCTLACSDSCTPGSRQCSGDLIQDCVIAPSGCYAWGTASSCGGNQACSSGHCVLSCSDACSSGTKQCASGGVQTCQLGTSGCNVWSSASACTGNTTCSGGQCVQTCSDLCTPGTKQCSGVSGIQTCSQQSNGCYDWGSSGTCPSGYQCQSGACAPSCTDACSAGSKQCSGAQVQSCAIGSNGCYAWSSASSCQSNYTCQAGQCVLACTDACVSGTSQCQGSQLQPCVLQSSGCYGWGTAQTCQTNYACSGGQCVLSCTNKCQQGSSQCASGTTIQSCVVQSNGCTDWAPAASCGASSTCTAGACVSATCNVGDTRCGQNVVEQCNSAHQWQTIQVCAQGCTAATVQCASVASCTAGALQCAGTNVVEQCNPTGSAWQAVATCASSCVAGLCGTPCTAGEKRCNGATPETCNATGTGWTQSAACATTCVASVGACAETSLTIDANSNQTLDGEHFYDGDVVIKNTSVLTVPSGRLVIHARSFTLDATSAINVAATCNDARGRGSDTGVSSCSATYCTASATVPAGSGGSFGTVGASGLQSTSCYYGYASPYYFYCNAARTAPAAYGIADDEAACGGKGGTGTSGVGGFGGGLLAVYAPTVTVQGAITAKGADGSGVSGGGAGGGVVLRATGALTFSGSINVSGGNGAGGGGAGGAGTVKLLYGNTKSVAGTITPVGSSFQSYMPPFDLGSATHPRTDRWYNDGFSQAELSWSDPYTQAGGYYTKLSTTYAAVPTQATATFQTPETVQFAQSALSAGTNYLHAVTLGPGFTVGTVEGRFPINVNATPPTVSSSSSHNGTTWNANTSVFVEWTLPQADANTTAFWFAWDRYAATQPDKASTRRVMDLADPTTSKKYFFPGNANGIWYFHILSEDTMGYLTKAATHYRVLVGANPGLGSVSGTVYLNDGVSLGPLAGATVTLNRGVNTTTTNGTGGFSFPNTVYAQDYEIRASKTGYKDATATITVVANQTTTQNLTETP